MNLWTIRLIAINVVFFLLQQAIPGFTEKLWLLPFAVLHRPWMVITYKFLHGGFMHLLFNMMGLYFFGPRLEETLGGTRFLILYFVSGIVAAVTSFVFMPMTPVVGASGAIFGVLLGYAHHWPKDQILIWGIVPIEARWFVIVMTALSLFGGFGGVGGDIAHFAHLGGFLGGWICVKYFDRTYRDRLIPKEPTAAKPSSVEFKRWLSIDRTSLHEVNREEYDRIMQKIRTSGPETLTQREREFLDRFSTN
jgi:membrane associated rhomboid family serine protease